MKRYSLILSLFLICYGAVLNAQALSKDEPSSQQLYIPDFLKKVTPEFLYGYTDFNFKSNSGGSFNKYNGHSNLYSVGGDHIAFGDTWMAGLYYFGIDTTVSSKFLFTPGVITSSDQTIRNNTIFGHILKLFTSEIFADLAGGYGFNKFITITDIPLVPEPLIAQATNNNNNWFLSLNGIYRKTWDKVLLRANLGALYSQIDTANYSFFVPATNTFLLVQPLVNKATLIMENVELGYQVNPRFMPFISGGLIQVAQFSNSRTLINPAVIINGSLPQLNMDKSGFRIGGGFVYTYKNLTLRLEEKYYNAGNTFQSAQTLAAVEYQFG
jgi:hypothetical protein